MVSGLGYALMVYLTLATLHSQEKIIRRHPHLRH